MYEQVEVDVKKQASKDQASLHLAVRENSIEEIKRLLSLGADVKSTNGNGMTPFPATEFNVGDSHFDTIKLLLENGVDVNARDYDGNTALHHLVWKADVEVVQLLLDFKADVNVKDDADEIPLWGAVRARKPEIVKLLIEQWMSIV